MYAFNIHAIAPFVSHLISITVCIFVISKNPRSKLHVTLGIFCFFASLWQFGTGMMFMAQTDKLAIFWDRIVYIGVNFMWMMHFHFSILFSKSDDKKYWLVAAYLLAGFYSMFIFSDLLVHDLYRYSWGCHTIAGPLHHTFMLVSTGFYMKSLYLIYRSYKRSNNEREKAQYKYYFVGFTIYVSASLAYLPAYKIPIYPFTYWFETIYCIILVYIIIKHQMLDIETVAHKTLLWLNISAISLIPSALLLYVLYPFLVQMPMPQFLMSTMAVVIGVIILYAIVQPRIDSVFERRKYNYRAIVSEFTDIAVTLHDKEKLARITEETLKKALNTKTVRGFWMSHGKLNEAVTGDDIPLQLEMEQDLMNHLSVHHDPLELDFVINDPVHAPFQDKIIDLFERTGTFLAVPIIHERQLLGIITLDKKSTLKAYTDIDKRFLKELIVGISFSIINSQMFETQRELLEKEKEARQVQEELVRVKDSMNKELEWKVEERTRELNLTLEQVRTANNHIMESIRYSRIIQTSLLPDRNRVSEILPNSFFIWKPRDIVGGDIYYCEQLEKGIIIALIDCTGHGVPGAFMTMLASSGLQRIIGEERITEPATILRRMNHIIKTSLQQNKKDSKSNDGLDAAICFYEFETRELLFAASRLSLYIIEEGVLDVIKGDPQSIGYVSSDLFYEFTTHRITHSDQDKTFYMTTDGYLDQLGGDRNKRFGSKRFQQLIQDIHPLDFDKQKDIMIQTITKYRGDNSSTDDVTMAGFSFAPR